MNDSSGALESIWLGTSGIEHRPPLQADTTADVCIVGAGIAGLTTAYLLAQDGQRVVVLDDGAIGSGETGRTTAHLSAALDDRYFELERLHGGDGARLAAESHMQAIDRIAAIVTELPIDCGFERLDGYLFAHTGGDGSTLHRELAAAQRAGCRVQLRTGAPIPGFETGECLCFAGQAQFHPMRYLAGLASAIERRGGRIHCGTHVSAFEDEPALVRTNTGQVVSAGAVVVATGTPVNDRVTMHTKQAAYRTYVVGLRVAAGAVPRALYWDTGDPYHYVRLFSDPGADDVLIVGGEDHKTGQAADSDERFSRLVAWTRERFTAAGDVLYKWSGQVVEPVDGLAFIGRNPGDQRTYIATGDSGHGMTHGTIAGMLLTDLIAGREHRWATLYEPGRVSVRAAGEFARENLNVAAQYTDHVTKADIESLAQLRPGCGAVYRDGISHVAAYRDAEGIVHRLSATCPHLGCVVGWNPAEQTWDCPCHGSRFATSGEVLNGPALTGLTRLG